MTLTRSGIPTTHRGTNFRSRLEARWAAFFDLVGWSWVYEPFDADGWIPDFQITDRPRNKTVSSELIEGYSGPKPFLVEVGPCATEEDYTEKAAKPRHAATDLPVVIVGTSPISPLGDGWQEALGLQVNGGEWPAPALVGICPGCGRVCVTHKEGVFTHRPCGHYTGGDTGNRIDRDVLEDLWARAGNTVQWRP